MSKRRRRGSRAGLPAKREDAKTAALRAAAVAHARQYVRRLKDGTIPASALPPELARFDNDPPISWFTRENSRAWVKARLKADALKPQRASYVCGLARAGWTVADEALREIIVEHKERGEKLLTSLSAYDIEITQSAGSPRRGGWTAEVVLRDLAILCVVADSCHAFDLHPTRSRSPESHGLSGCSIAAAALYQENVAVSEPAVVKVWTRSSFLLAPG
jgi:hypothetical protein